MKKNKKWCSKQSKHYYKIVKNSDGYAQYSTECRTVKYPGSGDEQYMCFHLKVCVQCGYCEYLSPEKCPDLY